MISLNSPKPLFLLNRNKVQSPQPRRLSLRERTRKSISAAATPPSPSNQVYQPFRPPPSPLPSQFQNLEPNRRLEILGNRLGLWFEFAPLISSLIREGFSPSSIEESTGISGVEQNRIVVAAQVRDSLVQFKLDPETLAFFDSGGAEVLYEIRLLSTAQRTSAARFIVQNRLDGQGAQELARAIKDFPRRRGDNGWDSFDYTLPGDCLSFMYFRQSGEHGNLSEQRTSALQRALEVAETEKAKQRIMDELNMKSDGGKGIDAERGTGVKVPVVRMKIGEVAEATTVVVLPVCEAKESESGLEEAPADCRSEGEFGVVVAEKGWKKWVTLPGWKPVVAVRKGGVVVAFEDARVLPWKANRWYNEEAILVVADRGKKEVVAEDGFYLVSSKDGVGLKVERGSVLKEMEVKESLGSVVLVVRPPREETDDQLQDDDWE